MGFLYSQFFVTPPYPTTSFAGKICIVTGSNIGLGKEAARHMARLDAAKVILAVRNLKAGEEAKRDIERSLEKQQQKTSGSPGVCEVWELDLASYDSVKAFAERATSTLPRLDVVLENAAIATDKFSLAEGHERTVTVNVISTFLLAFLLLPKLKQTAKQFDTNPVLTVVSSAVHGWTDLPEAEEPNTNTFAALSDEKIAVPQRMKLRYPTSKLLEVLVVRELAPKLQGSGVVLNMLNPGLCHSALARDSGFALTVMKFFLARSTEVGSRTLVASACAGLDSHGAYMDDSKVANELLSPYVTSEAGLQAQKKVYRELAAILEEIQPGVTSNV